MTCQRSLSIYRSIRPRWPPRARRSRGPGGPDARGSRGRIPCRWRAACRWRSSCRRRAACRPAACPASACSGPPSIGPNSAIVTMSHTQRALQLRTRTLQNVLGLSGHELSPPLALVISLLPVFFADSVLHQVTQSERGCRETNADISGAMALASWSVGAGPNLLGALQARTRCGAGAVVVKVHHMLALHAEPCCSDPASTRAHAKRCMRIPSGSRCTPRGCRQRQQPARGRKSTPARGPFDRHAYVTRSVGNHRSARDINVHGRTRASRARRIRIEKPTRARANEP
jgi:hypothetical protein